MTSPKHVALQVLVLLVALSHAAIGLALMISPGLQDQMATLYGAEVQWTPELRYLLKPMGAFMLALGCVGLLAARKPASHPGIVLTFAGLLLIRVAQRAVFRSEIQELFALSTWKLWSAAGLFLVLAIALVGLLAACRSGRRAKTA